MPAATPPSDSEFDALYRRHGPAAFRRATRMLGQSADAHELVHDVFVSLYENPEQYRGQSTMTTFLYSAITHACLNHIRHRRNRLRLLREHPESLVGLSRPAAPDTDLALRQALAQLPQPLAQVAVYHHMDGMQQQEIADVMGCSVRKVAGLLLRLRQETQQGVLYQEATR